ncbi:MAG: hypothetical protein HDT28_05800 [Clostridiales bacterium]|nr:hypothetical protein [Clostridiales bacterium]
MAVKKKRNVFVRYFTPFGLRQVGDIAMIIGFILLIVGLATVDGVLIAGIICYLLGSGIAIARCCMVLFAKDVNHRDPAYKSAIINVAIMGVLFALAVFCLVWVFVA